VRRTWYVGWSVVVAGVLAACATGGAPDPLTLSGQITYRERIALPPGTVASVALVERSGDGGQERTIVDERIASVSQVPIRFTLRFPASAIDTARLYGLRARLEDVAGRALFETPEPIGVQPARNVRVELLVQRARVSGVEPGTTPVAPTTFTCERLRFTVGFPEQGVMWLRTDTDSLVLRQALAASGARYRNERVEFWNRGDEARVVMDGDTLQCRVALPSNDPWERARAAGVDVRAVGQEPGWFLELTEGVSVVLVTEYGRRRDAFLQVERKMDSAGLILYGAQRDGRSVEVAVRQQPCSDTMSGERFPLTVMVRREGGELHGCGRRLR
jgi:putative lipoprotein